MLPRGVQTGDLPHRLIQLRTQLDNLAAHAAPVARRVPLGWSQADGWLGGGLCCGAVHEWIGLAGVPPITMLIHVAAQAASVCDPGATRPWLVCVGREVWPTPHTVVRESGDHMLQRMLLIDPPTDADRHWATELALRCDGLIVVADAGGMDMANSRRLQLAAESGRSLGLLARPRREADALSVATTRWLVQPEPTDVPRPRWRVTLARCKGLQSVQSHTNGTQDGVPVTTIPRIARGSIMDDRSLLVEVNDAGGLVPVHADIRERRDPAAAAS